ncbi:hypothetical protein [Dactylosporangium sp. NPDC000521]|uniref:hypothetical protein n=1 Tax=Dactylosporangium sp. NPDC000521 TaxID=3363975 RepID=UPI003696D534
MEKSHDRPPAVPPCRPAGPRRGARVLRRLHAAVRLALHLDTAFIELDGTEGTDGANGAGVPANVDQETAGLNRAVLPVTERVVCNADHTAWHRRGDHHVMPAGALLLVDTLVRADLRDDLTLGGVRPVVAHGRRLSTT